MAGESGTTGVAGTGSSADRGIVGAMNFTVDGEDEVVPLVAGDDGEGTRTSLPPLSVGCSGRATDQPNHTNPAIAAACSEPDKRKA